MATKAEEREQGSAKSLSCVPRRSARRRLTCGWPRPSEPPYINTIGAGGTYGAALWRLPPSGGELERVAELKGHAGAVRGSAWHAAEPDALVSLDEGHLRTWRLRGGAAQACSVGSSKFPHITLSRPIFPVSLSRGLQHARVPMCAMQPLALPF